MNLVALRGVYSPHLDQPLARGCPHCGGPTGCLRQTSLRRATFKSGCIEIVLLRSTMVESRADAGQAHGHRGCGADDPVSSASVSPFRHGHRHISVLACC